MAISGTVMASGGGDDASAGAAGASLAAASVIERVEALEARERLYDARQVLREAARSATDFGLLSRLARLEDIGGTSAADAYAQLVLKMEKTATRPADYARVVERGLDVALRENDAERAAFFRARIASRNDSTASRSTLSEKEDLNTIAIPGGKAALGLLLHLNPDIGDHFLEDYCRSLLRAAAGSPRNAAILRAKMGHYFALVSSLEAQGRRSGRRVTVTVSRSGKTAGERAARVLDLLGLRLRASAGETTVNAGERASQALRQELTAALLIDTGAMEQALQAGRPFTFELVDDEVPVVLDESAWRKAGASKDFAAGGLAEALARDLRIAEVYAGLATLDGRARSALLAAVPLAHLVTRYSPLVHRYGAHLGAVGGPSELPGGAAAAPAWESIAGVPAKSAGQLYQALLDKDGGKLLAFFSSLRQLDVERQRFFTRSPARLSRLYALFRESADVAYGAGRPARQTPFLEFLREVPLDERGNIRFPGGAAAWRHKGPHTSQAGAAVPEDENDILVELTETRYDAAGAFPFSELDSLLAVARINSRRAEPLDEASVRLLARHYPEHYNVYPYFARLTGLAHDDYQRFFALLPGWRMLSRDRLNAVAGEFHALTRLIAAAQESNTLAPAQSARLFRKMCEDFARASSDGEYAAVSLDVMREMLSQAARHVTDPDQAIEEILLGSAAASGFALNSAAYDVDAAAARRASFRKVLSAQRVPRLAALFSIRDAGAALAAGGGPPGSRLAALEGSSRLLPDVPGLRQMEEGDRQWLHRFDAQRVCRLAGEFRKAVTRNPADRRRLASLQNDLLTALQPQVQLALSGLVYAWFLRAEDMLVSEDAALLRKHRFVEPSRLDASLFPNAAIRSGGAGSHLSGGFGDFAVLAGEVAAIGGGLDEGTQHMFAAHVASMRAVNWGRLEQRHLRLVGLRIRLAREWIARSSRDRAVFAELAAACHGLLSAERRAVLLRGIGTGDWNTVWQSITYSELYFLSERYLRRYAADPWDSPVASELRQLLRSNDSDAFAPARWLGCGRSRSFPPAPYEEYERDFLPHRLSERSAEFSLYLADQADRAGVPAAVLGAIAEEAARSVWAEIHMAHPWDWRAVLAAYARFGERSIPTLPAKQ